MKTISPVQLPQNGTVFQRGRNGNATIAFAAEGPAQARIVQGNKVVVPWHKSKGGVRNVPAGGPYTLEIKTDDGRIRKATDLLVGDLWVLAGQSNMDGCGKLTNLEPPSRHVHCYYYTESWGVAKDPLCVLLDSIDPVHWGCDETKVEAARAEDRKFREFGASLGVRFGKMLHKATGVPIGLIPCSNGGTSMEQWDPAKKDLGGQSLYGSMQRRVRACGGKVTGVLWYQGESDAQPAASGLFKDRMKAFVETLRADLAAPRLPFIQVQLSRFFIPEEPEAVKHWDLIQQIQLDLETEIPNLATVAAIDGTLADLIHLDAISLRILGERMAELAQILAYGKKAPRALRPGTIRFTNASRTRLRIAYKNVRGKLRPAKDVRGYWLEDPTGARIAILSTRTDGNAVLLDLERPAPEGSRLWYGRGVNPLTNLRDDLFAAPAFGPIEV